MRSVYGLGPYGAVYAKLKVGVTSRRAPGVRAYFGIVWL